MFLWELATLCPVPYFEDGPVRGWDGWNDINRRLEDFNFKVIVDGYELRKPILLPERPLVPLSPKHPLTPVPLSSAGGSAALLGGRTQGLTEGEQLRTPTAEAVRRGAGYCG